MCEHGTKTVLVSLPADGEASWSLLPSLVSLLLAGTVQPETPIPISSKWQVRSEKAKKKKRISINSNHSYHQRSSPSASINWCNNKARFIFNQLYRKRWCAKLVTVKRLLHHDTITRRVTNQGKSGAFSPLAEIDPAEHQPSISMSFR